MPEVDGSSSLAVTVLVVLPVALLAAVLPCLIWSLVRSKGREAHAPETLLYVFVSLVRQNQ